MVLLDAVLRKPNYQFRCPRCGHAITALWAEPLEKRDLSTLFTLECSKTAGGCGAELRLARMAYSLIQLNRRICKSSKNVDSH